LEVEQGCELNSEDKDQESRSSDGLAQSVRGPQVGGRRSDASHSLPKTTSSSWQVVQKRSTANTSIAKQNSPTFNQIICHWASLRGGPFVVRLYALSKMTSITVPPTIASVLRIK
jgi:hypothetical protein